MAYPSLEQYNEALQSPQLVLLDPDLKQAQLKKTGLGLPQALCGGFALTYTVTVGTRKFALRCFHKESRELERRYQAISARLKQLNSPYFLPFEFKPNGVRVQGNTYPIVKMEWAKGRTLAEFLEAEHRNTSALQKLRQALASLAAFLEQNNLAHGDIQPENIMVSGDGSTVQLIDYDGLYVEALKGSKAAELGQINFQHPQRSADDFGPTLDRFSFLTLDVALQTLIASPRIWTTSRSEPSAVVFRRNDFLNPGVSSVFQEAVVIPSARTHVENLAKVASGNFSTIPSLGDFLQGRGVLSGPITIRPNYVDVVYQGPYAVCDAANYGQVLQMVGSRVELVGRVHSVKNGWAQNRKPYVFINFSDWRGQAVKLAIWADGLDSIKPDIPNESWMGRWLSITGLVDPPYSNRVRTVSYTHLSITITARGQIQQLPEQEAKFRLGSMRKSASGPVGSTSSRNADILQGMGGKRMGRTPPVPTPTAAPRPAQSRNQQVLTGMHRQGPAKTPTLSPQMPTGSSGASQRSRQSSSSNHGWLPLVICGVVLLLLAKACVG
ncbi:Serine/threonine protein kinase [plant metagenome]|uniref:Serine/threonine protein kinase n=1 Tax=plant metagenome TaxID=1297885 RepID=A0A484PRG3_9ZZZZ